MMITRNIRQTNKRKHTKEALAGEPGKKTIYKTIIKLEVNKL